MLDSEGAWTHPDPLDSPAKSTMELYDNLLETLGDTPLVSLRRYSPTGATLSAHTG